MIHMIHHCFVSVFRLLVRLFFCCPLCWGSVGLREVGIALARFSRFRVFFHQNFAPGSFKSDDFDLGRSLASPLLVLHLTRVRPASRFARMFSPSGRCKTSTPAMFPAAPPRTD